MNAIKQIRLQIPYEVFSELDFQLIKRDLSQTAQHALMGRLIKKGDLIRVRRGLYTFEEFWRRKPLSTFTLANKILIPSYISFESALSHHGLIPEAVYTTTSACFQRDQKSFKTPFGDFTFQHVPAEVFLLGVISQKTEAGPQLMATPLKALFDLIYFQRKYIHSLKELEDDLRISPDKLLTHAHDLGVLGLEELAKMYRKKTCEALLRAIKKEMK